MAFITRMYGKPRCVQCDFTERELKKNGVDYEKFDVVADPDALDYVKSLGYLQAPVVVVLNESGAQVDHWSGFQPERIKKHFA